MSILTQSGRAAIAASIKKQSIHLAWGTGDSSSGSSHQVEKVFVEGEIALGSVDKILEKPYKSPDKI
ncbi:hypothetical protein [Wolbachia endosymbiont (group A) of Barypeithes pellucidus]|uniref:hypothetical protein n=1 Tax=Wolbachia endosymbiont (group A) of Barypeithes pellucidus TaxID=3139322 RepID=UPI003CCAE35F